MRDLLEGWKEFCQRELPRKQQLFERLAGGQSPAAVFITCSDSRIVPELITQTEPGDLFVLRNAGNIVPPADAPGAGGEAATLEYAVNVLKVPQIVVCGHSHCGAIAGLLNPASTTQLPVVTDWLSGIAHVRDEVERQFAHLSDEERLLMAVRTNVRAQLESLRSYPFVAEAIDQGRLTIAGWVYRFETGELEVLDQRSEEFVSVERATNDATV